MKFIIFAISAIAIFEMVFVPSEAAPEPQAAATTAQPTPPRPAALPAAPQVGAAPGVPPPGCPPHLYHHAPTTAPASA